MKKILFFILIFFVFVCAYIYSRYVITQNSSVSNIPPQDVLPLLTPVPITPRKEPTTQVSFVIPPTVINSFSFPQDIPKFSLLSNKFDVPNQIAQQLGFIEPPRSLQTKNDISFIWFDGSRSLVFSSNSQFLQLSPVNPQLLDGPLVSKTEVVRIANAFLKSINLQTSLLPPRIFPIKAESGIEYYLSLDNESSAWKIVFPISFEGYPMYKKTGDLYGVEILIGPDKSVFSMLLPFPPTITKSVTIQPITLDSAIFALQNNKGVYFQYNEQGIAEREEMPATMKQVNVNSINLAYLEIPENQQATPFYVFSGYALFDNKENNGVRTEVFFAVPATIE